jgi:hypothetical protein
MPPFNAEHVVPGGASAHRVEARHLHGAAASLEGPSFNVVRERFADTERHSLRGYGSCIDRSVVSAIATARTLTMPGVMSQPSKVE